MNFDLEIAKVEDYNKKKEVILRHLSYCNWICVFIEIFCLFILRNVFLGLLFFALVTAFTITALYKNLQFHKVTLSKLEKIKKQLEKEEQEQTLIAKSEKVTR